MNAYLPKDKIFIPQLQLYGVVIGVYISTSGIEYKVRYFKEDTPIECYFFDFELEDDSDKINA